MTDSQNPWIADVSPLARMGLKGAAAADWLARTPLDVPARANTWTTLGPGSGSSSWSLLARLGTTEFFLEEDASAEQILALARELGHGRDHVYPVLREDRAFVLGGHGAEEVLAQVCNVDFAGLSLEANPAVLTLMTGVAVLVVPQREQAGRRYRIWCDPSFGRCLWSTLHAIVLESGGTELGLEQMREGPRLARTRQ